MIEHARQILADLAPEIDVQGLTESTPLADLGLDIVTRFALGAGLERALKVEIPDDRITGAATLEEMVGDYPTL